MHFLSETAVFQSPCSFLPGDLIRSTAARQQECRVVIIKRIVAGDAGDRIPLRIRKTAFVLALDIENTCPGRGIDIGRSYLVIINRGLWC